MANPPQWTTHHNKDGTAYYYNAKDDITQWNDPTATSQTPATAPPLPPPAPQTPAVPPPPTAAPLWTTHHTNEGTAYYHNAKGGTTQWDDPNGSQEIGAAPCTPPHASALPQPASPPASAVQPSPQTTSSGGPSSPPSSSQSPPRSACTYLNVPYDDKDSAKEMGAKFDWARKLWYVLTDDPIALANLVQRWPMSPPKAQ